MLTVRLRNQAPIDGPVVSIFAKSHEKPNAKIKGEDDADRLFDIKGIIHKEFVPTDQTVNAAFYDQVLRRLLQRIRRVRSELHETRWWILLHDNAPTHSAILLR